MKFVSGTVIPEFAKQISGTSMHSRDAENGAFIKIMENGGRSRIILRISGMTVPLVDVVLLISRLKSSSG
jgi:hypothetical protein